jgi:nucleoside-diphosphate-sugar epimerase
MKRALITGFAGFVGRRFTRRLLNLGWHVTGVDNMVASQHPKEWAFQPKELVNLTAHYRDVRDCFRDLNPFCYDLIIHLAAVVGGRLKIEGDPLAVATDLAIDADFFRWLAANSKSGKLPKVIYFSSSAVYPVWMQRASRMRMKEHFVDIANHKIDMPDSTYGWAKLTGELLAQHAVKTYGLDVVIYRPFSGYGEDQDMAYPFPSIIRRVVNREDPITIWGSGNQTRDFIYIEDVIDAVLATKDELQPGEALNLGSGVGTSFKDLVQKAGVVLWSHDRKTVHLHCDITKPEGVFYRVADTEKLNLMYQPTTSLEEGIRKVAAHLTAAKT